MINRIFILIITLFVSFETIAQSQGGLEQYYYVKGRDTVTMVPMAHVQTEKNWYIEGRFNYEDFRTASVYGGKMFTKDTKKSSYAVVPMLGVVAGKYKGGSLGLNVNIEHGKFYFSSQTQYTFSIKNRSDNFFYSWSEAGIAPVDWFYAGAAIQQTDFKRGTELGGVLGLTFGKWTFPLYAFSPFSEGRYFVLGLISSFGLGKKNILNVRKSKGLNVNTVKL